MRYPGIPTIVQVVRHMHKNKDEFRPFLGEDWDRYMQACPSCAAAAPVPGVCVLSVRAASQPGPDLRYLQILSEPLDSLVPLGFVQTAQVASRSWQKAPHHLDRRSMTLKGAA